jgi:hypothetical protein
MASRRLFDGGQQELGLLPIQQVGIALFGEATATVTAAATLTSLGVRLAGEATASATAVGAVVITADVRATQALVETLYTDSGDPRVTQALVETLYTDSGDPRVTQTVVEVLYRWRLRGEAVVVVVGEATIANQSSFAYLPRRRRRFP